jgi:hypothetical protein
MFFNTKLEKISSIFRSLSPEGSEWECTTARCATNGLLGVELKFGITEVLRLTMFFYNPGFGIFKN